MSERGLVVSEIVAQLVADARRHEGLSTDELADRAGIHPSLRRPARAAGEAADARRRREPGRGARPAPVGARGGGRAGRRERRRSRDRAASRFRARGTSTAATSATGARLAGATELTPADARPGDRVRLPQARPHRRADARGRLAAAREARRLVDLTATLADLLGAGLARASNGRYAQNGPDTLPSLLPLHPGPPELELKAALETTLPARGSRGAGAHLIFRYVLAEPGRQLHAREGLPRRDGLGLGGPVRRARATRTSAPAPRELEAQEGRARGHGAPLLRPGAPAVREGHRRLRAQLSAASSRFGEARSRQGR